MAEEMVRVELDPASLRKILLMAKEARPVLRRATTATLRAAAEPAAQASRDKVLGPVPEKMPQRTLSRIGRQRPASTRSYHSGLRAGIAAGVKISVRAGSETRDAGIRITSGNTALRPDQYRMNRTYKNETFRHPVFGKGSAVQHGQTNWFYGPLNSRHTEFEASVLAAMKIAAEGLAQL